jgi:sugar phosphate isomerase/epimerase
MDVACSTFCFLEEPLDLALRRIAELEFTRVDLGVSSKSPHVTPDDVASNPNGVISRIRQGPTISISGVTLRLDDATDHQALVEGAAHLAKQLATAVLTIEPSNDDRPLAAEVERLSPLLRASSRQGVTLCALTKRGSVAGTPNGAADLCEKLPGLGISLDPSHVLFAGGDIDDWEPVFPHVRNVFLRDSSQVHGQFQTAVGRGEIDYSKIVIALQKFNYRGALVVDFEREYGGEVDPQLEARKLGRVLESLL